jgi:hypothetical protein
MRQKLRRVVRVVAVLAALSITGIAVSSNAEASYGTRDALGTIGIATGIGAVIGLSTLPFYSSPTAHFQNVLMGAGAGLVAGLGVAVYLLEKSSSDDEINP